MFWGEGNVYTAYVYVDGENHYIGAERTWRKLYGEYATLDMIRPEDSYIHPNDCFFPVEPRIRLHHTAKFFWDALMIYNTRLHGAGTIPRRAVYFTAMPGNQEVMFQANQFIRQAGFEPLLLNEAAPQGKRRAERLKNENLLIKPKGVDINLTVRMLEDAHNDNYDQCWLFTSDKDMLAAIRAVRRMGKRVWVMGYGEQVGKDSPFMYEPDAFVDLEDYFRTRYKIDEEALEVAKKKAAPAPDEVPAENGPA